MRRNRIITILSILGGSGLGYLYWYYVGCNSGTCPLKQVWYMNVVLGGIIGYLINSTINDILKKFKKK